MADPLLATTTAAALEASFRNPPHALLLTGQSGVGKRTIAEWMVERFAVGAQLLMISPEKNKQTISIEAIREIERFTALKVTNQQSINRIICIPDAESLTTEAQNAMLKTLEEPPVGTLLLMTTSQPGLLLPTIRSRLQTIEVIAPPAEQLAAILPASPSLSKAQVMSMSGGLPGLALTLATAADDNPLIAAANNARTILKASVFERLSLVDTLAKDRQLAANSLDMLMRMSHAALAAGSAPAQWQRIMASSYDAKAALANNVQPKLALTNLMLTL